MAAATKYKAGLLNQKAIKPSMLFTVEKKNQNKRLAANINLLTTDQLRLGELLNVWNLEIKKSEGESKG